MEQNCLFDLIQEEDLKQIEKDLTNVENINEINEELLTALQIAIMEKKTELVRLLLKNGANPNHYLYFLYSPLRLAILEENEEMIIELLNYEAEVEVIEKKIGFMCVLTILKERKKHQIIDLILKHAKEIEDELKITLKKMRLELMF